MKSLRYGMTFVACFCAPAALANEIEHFAALAICDLDSEVHGICLSKSKASTLNYTDSIDIDCGLYRDGVRVVSRRANLPAQNTLTRFKTTLHTPFYYNKQYCVQNRSKYRALTIFGTPRIVGQDGAMDCEYVYRQEIQIR